MRDAYKNDPDAFEELWHNCYTKKGRIERNCDFALHVAYIYRMLWDHICIRTVVFVIHLWLFIWCFSWFVWQHVKYSTAFAQLKTSCPLLRDFRLKEADEALFDGRVELLISKLAALRERKIVRSLEAVELRKDAHGGCWHFFWGDHCQMMHCTDCRCKHVACYGQLGVFVAGSGCPLWFDWLFDREDGFEGERHVTWMDHLYPFVAAKNRLVRSWLANGHQLLGSIPSPTSLPLLVEEKSEKKPGGFRRGWWLSHLSHWSFFQIFWTINAMTTW